MIYDYTITLDSSEVLLRISYDDYSNSNSNSNDSTIFCSAFNCFRLKFNYSSIRSYK